MANKENQIVIYEGAGGEISLTVDAAHDTIWATHQQIADLFGIDRSGATRHINKILQSGEVGEKSNVQKMHIANADRPVTFYSLDVILSVGYRTNSARAIEFRKWANSVLRSYILKGSAVNQKRLEQLGTVVHILGRSSDEMVSGVAF